MTPQPPRFFPPQRRFRAADQLLPLFGAAFGVSACVLLWTSPEVQLVRVPLVFGGWLLGLILPRLYAHRGRCLGTVPFCTTAAFVVVLIAQLMGEWTYTVVGLFCLFGGYAAGAILRYRDKFRTDQKTMVLAASFGTLLAVGAIAAFLMVGHASDEWKAIYGWLLLALTGLIAAVSSIDLFRLGVEFSLEVPVGSMYRISQTGPGIPHVPQTGPCLIIANHGAWFDPVFIGKVFARELTPMMTASFYDIKFLTPFMRMIHVIRVPEKPLKRDAPEVHEAIAALDAGHCVLIFPEGYLRRKEEQYVRRFGQGAWQILAARPDTPVVPCWIEGSWGSYCSYFGGPPTMNKKPDFRRRIHVAVNPVVKVPREILDNSLIARAHLANLVLAARTVLGLPMGKPVEVAMKDEEA